MKFLEKKSILGIVIVLVSVAIFFGCSEGIKETGQSESLEPGFHDKEGLREGNGTGARDGSGTGEFGKGVYGEGDKQYIEEVHGYVDLEGNNYTAEELNAKDKSSIVIEESMTLDEISQVSMIKVWHFVADFNLPQGVDTSKTIAELNEEDDINLDVDEIKDYIVNFKHGLGHHPAE